MLFTIKEPLPSDIFSAISTPNSHNQARKKLWNRFTR